MAFYQTTPLPDSIEEGLFPTVDWFKLMEEVVSFKGKSVLDIGCNHFSYGIQATLCGAKQVVGLEVSPDAAKAAEEIIAIWNNAKPGEFNKCSVVCSRLEDQELVPKHDIVIFGMVIYWLEDAVHQIQRVLEQTKKYSVFIFRPPTDDSNHFQPTMEQLIEVIRRPVAKQIVLKDTPDEHIDMVIFSHGKQRK